MGNSDVDLLSDRAKGGLYGLIYQTAGLLADNISSLNVSQINGRVSQIWTADNDAMARTAELVLTDIYSGKPYKVVSQDIIDKVGVLPAGATGQTNTLLNLIEAHQYILAQFYREIGIGDNFNMKRERINTAETELMTGSLDVNVWNMLKNRVKAVEQINELFGTNISVRFNENVYTEEEGEEEAEEPAANSEDTVEQEQVVEEEQTDAGQVEEEKTEEIIKEDKEGE